MFYILFNKMYRLKLLENSGMKFRPDMSIGEDLLFNVEVFKGLSRISFVNYPLYHYVVKPSGSLAWGKIHDNAHLAYKEHYEAIYSLYKYLNVSDSSAYNKIEFRYIGLLRRYISQLLSSSERIKALQVLNYTSNDVITMNIIKKNRITSIHCAILSTKSFTIIYLFHIIVEKIFRKIKGYGK